MVELLPAVQPSEPVVTDLQEFSDDLSADAISLIDYATRRGRKPDRVSVREGFERAFQMIGGVPRLALWADRNPTLFYTLYAKLLPTQVEAAVLPSCPKELESLSASQLKQLVLQRVDG